MSLRATLRVGALVVLAALVLSGCRKKSAPQFYQLESNVTILADRDGDDAWSGDEMSTALAALKAIDPEAVEGPKAQALITKIEGERQRVAREKAEAEAVVAKVVPRPTVRLFDEPKGTGGASGASVATPDASVPDRPWGGMSVADFQKHFGRCMTNEGEQAVVGLGQATVFSVKGDDAACRKLYGLPDDGSVRQTFAFRNDQLANQRTESHTRTILDAGPPVYTVVDAGIEQRLAIFPQIRDVPDAGS
jgi:hypothetical protein